MGTPTKRAGGTSPNLNINLSDVYRKEYDRLHHEFQDLEARSALLQQESKCLHDQAFRALHRNATRDVVFIARDIVAGRREIAMVINKMKQNCEEMRELMGTLKAMLRACGVLQDDEASD